MTELQKKFLKDKDGNRILPITHMEAVKDSQGNSLASVLGDFEDEVRGLVDTPHQEYVTVADYASLPTSGSKDTIYRVSNYNGSTSQIDASVYSEYAWNGSQYIFLCVKSQIGEVFDISVYNNNAKYSDLASALGTDGDNIPPTLRRGGMSVKYVQTSDNKYVQFRCMADEFTTDTTQWAIADEGVYVENPEYVYVKTDAEGKILWAIKIDGSIYWGTGVPQQVVDYVADKISEYHLENVSDIVTFVGNLTEGDNLATLLAGKVDVIEGKSLIDSNYASSMSTAENPEFMSVETDLQNIILGGRKKDGTKFENVGLDINGHCLKGEKFEDNVEATVDKDNKIISYRDKRGILHEEAGIDTEKISLSEEGYKELKDALNITEPEQSQGIEKIGDGVLEGNVCIDYYNPYSDLDMENMLKLKGNLHGHTTNSDSEITPEDYMIKYREAGYDFAAITDHDDYENGYYHPDYGSAPTPDPSVEGIIFIGPSYEDTSNTQHVNVYEIAEYLGFTGRRSTNEVLQKGAIERNRLCCLNHPNWPAQYLTDDYILQTQKTVNFVELWNGTCYGFNSQDDLAGACRAWDILLSSGHKVFGLAVDDYHLIPNHDENMWFRKGYVEVYSKGRTARDILRALAQGRFVACNANGSDNTIEITAIDCSDGKYHVELAEACDIYFFGVNGSILQENLSTTSATYILNGTEKYVRCAVHKGNERIWLQPLIRKSLKRTFNL